MKITDEDDFFRVELRGSNGEFIFMDVNKDNASTPDEARKIFFDDLIKNKTVFKSKTITELSNNRFDIADRKRKISASKIKIKHKPKSKSCGCK